MKLDKEKEKREVKMEIQESCTICLDDFEGNQVQALAQAREADIQKGMAPAQVTGSTSSYARKYALGGLFNLDDNKDPDSTNKHGKEVIKDEQGNNGAKIGLDQIDKIQQLIKLGKIDSDKMKLFYKVKTIQDLNYAQAEEIIKNKEKN